MHLHDWRVVAGTMNLKTGAPMVTCECGEVGWITPMPELDTVEQIEAFLNVRT